LTFCGVSGIKEAWAQVGMDKRKSRKQTMITMNKRSMWDSLYWFIFYSPIYHRDTSIFRIEKLLKLGHL